MADKEEENEKNKSCYILNLQANKLLNPIEIKDMKPYTCTLGYSLGLIELEKINKKFLYKKKNKCYSDDIVNVNFKYSVRNDDFKKLQAHNKIVYIKNNVIKEEISNIKEKVSSDGISIRENADGKKEILGLKVEDLISKKDENKLARDKKIELPKGFYIKEENKDNFTIDIWNTENLREKLYKDGLDITFIKGKSKPTKQKIHFVRFLHSPGSSKKGKCLFINQELLNKKVKLNEENFHELDKKEFKKLNNEKFKEYLLLGLKFNKDEENVLLPQLEAYKALLFSTIEDTITIDPKSILVVDEQKGEIKYTDNVILTSIVEEKDKTNELKTERKDDYKGKNNIWDGEILLDSSLFKEKGKEKKGSMILRNLFFKGNALNTNIQKFFKDKGIKDIGRLNGFTLAKDVKDIKMVTTDSTIKFLKFKNKFKNKENKDERKNCLEYYLKHMNNTFGILKYDQPPKNFYGKMVKTSYQLLQTLQMDKNQLKAFLKPNIDYINLLNEDNDYFLHYLRIRDKGNIDSNSNNTLYELYINLLKANRNFVYSNGFINFRNDVIKNLKDEMKKGRILINGTYANLFGNPYELLEASIKDEFPGSSIINKDEKGISKVICKRFKPEEKLLVIRSPHVCFGNIMIAENTNNDVINKYFNLSNDVILFNNINENNMNRLSGCDFDGDEALITNNRPLVRSAEEHYKDFPVPVTDIEGIKTPYKYKTKDLINMDYKSSQSQKMIGQIVNLSAILNAIYMDKLNNNLNKVTDKTMKELYKDITKLDILSGFEIDSTKKSFGNLNTKKELLKISKKYNVVKPEFFEYISDKKPETRPYDCTMDNIIETLKNGKVFNKRCYIHENDKKALLEFFISKKSDEDDFKEESKEKEFMEKIDKLSAILNTKYILSIKNGSSYNSKEMKELREDTTELYNMENSGETNSNEELEKLNNELLGICEKYRINEECITGHSNNLSNLSDDKEKTRNDNYIINKFLEETKKIENECNNLRKRTKEETDEEEKRKTFEQINSKEEGVITEYKNKLGKITIQKILKELIRKDEYNNISERAINILFKSNSESFLDLFIVNYDPVMITIRRYSCKDKKEKNIERKSKLIRNIFGLDFAPQMEEKQYFNNNKLLQKNSPLNFGKDVIKFLLKPDPKDKN